MPSVTFGLGPRCAEQQQQLWTPLYMARRPVLFATGLGLLFLACQQSGYLLLKDIGPIVQQGL
jgi:hypothetical protein